MEVAWICVTLVLKTQEPGMFFRMILVAFYHSQTGAHSCPLQNSPALKDSICFVVTFLEFPRLLAKFTHIQVPETQGPDPHQSPSLMASGACLSLPLTNCSSDLEVILLLSFFLQFIVWTGYFNHMCKLQYSLKVMSQGRFEW